MGKEILHAHITHVRKDTRPSPALLYDKQWKARRGLGTRLSLYSNNWSQAAVTLLYSVGSSSKLHLHIITDCQLTDVRIERVVERVWLCVGALGPDQRKEPNYQVAYHTYVASGRRLSYTLSIERVVIWKYTKHSLLVRQIFAIFGWRHAHMRKDTRLSPLYRTASDGKLGGVWVRGVTVFLLVNW